MMSLSLVTFEEVVLPTEGWQVVATFPDHNLLWGPGIQTKDLSVDPPTPKKRDRATGAASEGEGRMSSGSSPPVGAISDRLGAADLSRVTPPCKYTGALVIERAGKTNLVRGASLSLAAAASAL